MMNRLLLIVSFLFSLNGMTQNALNFDGVNDYVETDYPGISGTSARTVEAWIRTTAIANPSDGGTQQIITDWGTFVTAGRFTFNVLWANAIRVELGGEGLSGTIPVNDGEWHHVAVVYDPLAMNPYSLYVDGVLDVAGDLDLSINTVLGTDLRIGRRIDDARNFDGDIEEVRVWDYARTVDELIGDMNNEYCLAPEGLVAYYKFNQGIAGGSNPAELELEDFSGDGYDGDLMNFALSGPTSNWVEGVDLDAEITADMTASACLSYTVPSGDESYTESGVYMDTLTSAFGCDSILTIDLTIGTVTATIDVSSCDNYTVPSGDETHTISGTYMDTIPAVEGCDSIITINLTLNMATEGMLETFACESYTVPSGDETYTESGTYIDVIPNAAGCDSVITIELEIGLNTESSLFAEECYSYAAPSGDTYTESGTFTDIIENEAGCDSVITITLVIHEDTESSIAETVCDSYTTPSGDATYTEAGTYEDVIPNAAGCDSIITIELTIAEVNIAVTVADPMLSADAVGAIYQWLDCDADYVAIDGATEQEFMPTSNGNYAVIVTEDGCSDTSDCYTISTVGLSDHNKEKSIAFYPNPTKGSFWVNLEESSAAIQVIVYTATGQKVSEVFFKNQQSFEVDLAGESGVYFIQVITDADQFSFRISRR